MNIRTVQNAVKIASVARTSATTMASPAQGWFTRMEQRHPPRPHQRFDDAAGRAMTGRSGRTFTDRPHGWSAPDAKERGSVLRWCQRLCRGWYPRMRLDRRDAGPIVHVLWDFGEPAAAIEACKSVIASDAQHLHAYLHLIDLAARDIGDIERARRWYKRGIAVLRSARDRELLASFFVYTSFMN